MHQKQQISIQQYRIHTAVVNEAILMFYKISQSRKQPNRGIIAFPVLMPEISMELKMSLHDILDLIKRKTLCSFRSSYRLPLHCSFSFILIFQHCEFNVFFFHFMCVQWIWCAYYFIHTIIIIKKKICQDTYIYTDIVLRYTDTYMQSLKFM